MPETTQEKRNYKKTLNLPKTSFPMKANLAQNEPASEKRWEQGRLYDRIVEDLDKANVGLNVALVAEAYRLQNDAACGPFVRALLEKNQVMRLSKPALETLAIVAYRQPCLRSEIEEVRGVSVDAVLRKLIDMQLVRVVRRSELPGRPWLFGTTQKFLEHFGINQIEDLPGSQELKRALPADDKKKSTDTFPAMEEELSAEAAADDGEAEASVAALDEEIEKEET